MKIDDDTRLVKIDGSEAICEALQILAGSALLGGDRRLYEHIARAEAQYRAGVNLRLTDNL